MEDQSYNGWKNYETWLISLHINNSESLREYLAQVAADTAEGFPHEHGISRLIAVGEAVKDALLDYVCEELTSGSIAAECVHAVLGAVYWAEIAESLLED
jgi:aromatic ring-opening dioxygenase catalytic subunit (LigB family)